MIYSPSALATTQFLAYDVNLRQAYNVLQQRIAEHMQAEIEAVRDRYDGSSLKPIEQEIDRLFTLKEGIADTVSAVDRALERILTVREALSELYSLAQDGSVAGFESKYIYLNSQVGSRVLDDSNLVGRAGNGYWAEETRIVDAGSIDVEVSTHYIGNDWAIDLDSGETLVPDHSEGTLSGGGVTLSMADLTLVSRDGDAVTFTDGTNTYTGTLRRGGGGVLSPWLYNDFASEADRQEAMADVAAAMSRLDDVERELRQAKAILEGGENSAGGAMERLTERFERLQEEELDERQAAIKAIQTRYEMMAQSFAVTANTSLDFIERMFLTPLPGTQKQSIFGTIANSYGSFF